MRLFPSVCAEVPINIHRACACALREYVSRCEGSLADSFVMQCWELLLPSSFYITVRHLQTLSVPSSLPWPWSLCHLPMAAGVTDSTHKERRGAVQGVQGAHSAPFVTSFVFQWMQMPLWLCTWQLVIVAWMTVLHRSFFGIAVGELCV